MKCILYMALSLDGYIAGPNDDTTWVSELEYNAFRKFASNMGNAVYGRRTYDIGIQENIPPLAGALNVVVTRRPPSDYDPYLFTDESPREILDLLKNKGFSEILVCGGGKINGLFAKAGLIDEIYLDIEPVILGGGCHLFGNANIHLNLRLLGTKKLSPQTLQVHYKVVR